MTDENIQKAALVLGGAALGGLLVWGLSPRPRRSLPAPLPVPPVIMGNGNISKTTPGLPPSLPDAWVSSYTSYWYPMLDEPKDEQTSGCVWFDYNRGVFRIDGLFNPYHDEPKGSSCWMSEQNFFAKGDCYRYTLRFHAGQTPSGQKQWDAQALSCQQSPSAGCILPQNMLRDRNAVYIGSGTPELLGGKLFGFEVDGWQFERPNNKGMGIYYFKKGTNQLLRMISGDPSKHCSVRDFTMFRAGPIDPSTWQLFPEATSASAAAEFKYH